MKSENRLFYGRTPRQNEEEERGKERKRAGGARFSISDAAALVCALICAACLCAFCIGGGTGSAAREYVSTAAGITYTPPEKAKEWSFWDYFSELCAGLLGYDEA